MDLPLHPRPLLLQLLLDGIPPTLLLDLVDPAGMRAALAGELAVSDVTADADMPTTAEQAPVRVARFA